MGTVNRSWYSKGVSVQEPLWVDLPATRVTPPGRPLPQVGRKAFRPLLRAASATTQEPRVEGLPSGSSFVLDDTDLDRRLRQARTLWHATEASSHIWGAIEAEQGRKITFQRGGPPGWYVMDPGLVVPDTDTMEPAFRLLGQDLLARAPKERPPVRYKQGTSHGWPDYATSALSFVLHALWAASADGTWEAFTALGQRIAGAMGQADTPLSSIMYNRAGPLGKPVYAYETSGPFPTRVAQLTGLCCRRRVVYGMPSAGNMLQAAWANVLKAALYTHYSFYHPGGAPAVADKIRRMDSPDSQWLSDDITAFDTNVRHQHQLELATCIHGPIASDRWREFKAHWTVLPLLGPPIQGGSEAYLYTKRGGTPSGSIDTAIDGTLINAARIIMAVAAATRRSPRQVWHAKGSWWDLLCLGDDTLLRVPKNFDQAVYVRESERLGYPCRLSPHMVFLMNAFGRQGQWAPLATRVFQQTVFHEYGGGGPAAELFSFIARTSTGFWTLNPWASLVADLVGDAEPFARYKVTPVTAARALNDPVFTTDLARELHLKPARSKLLEMEEHHNLPPALSLFAARLLSRPLRPDATLPAIKARETDIMQIARYMGKTQEERQSAGELTGLSEEVQSLIDSMEN